MRRKGGAPGRFRGLRRRLLGCRFVWGVPGGALAEQPEKRTAPPAAQAGLRQNRPQARRGATGAPTPPHSCGPNAPRAARPAGPHLVPRLAAEGAVPRALVGPAVSRQLPRVRAHCAQPVVERAVVGTEPRCLLHAEAGRHRVERRVVLAGDEARQAVALGPLAAHVVRRAQRGAPGVLGLGLGLGCGFGLVWFGLVWVWVWFGVGLGGIWGPRTRRNAAGRARVTSDGRVAIN